MFTLRTPYYINPSSLFINNLKASLRMYFLISLFVIT